MIIIRMIYLHIWIFYSIELCSGYSRQILGNLCHLSLDRDSNVVNQMTVSTYSKRFIWLYYNNTLSYVCTWHKKMTKPHRLAYEGALFSLGDIFLLAQSYLLLRGESGVLLVAEDICTFTSKKHVTNGWIVICMM